MGSSPTGSRHRLYAAFAIWLVSAAVGAAERPWYEAYTLGVRALQAGDASTALPWLEQCARQRPEPGRNVRTYGTNFEPAYYPHLRLAQAHLRLGDAAAAAAALQRSDAYLVAPRAERDAVRAALAALTPSPTPPPAAAPTPPPVASSVPGVVPVPTAAEPVPTATPAPRVPPPPPATQAASQPSAVSPNTGVLELVALPGGATVYLDDEPLGTTDPSTGRFVKRGLQPGTHGLRVSRAGHADVRREIEVRASQPTRVSLALPDLPPTVPAADTGAAAPTPPTPSPDGGGPPSALVAVLVVLAAGLVVWAWRFASRPASGASATPTTDPDATPWRPLPVPTPEVTFPSPFGAYELLGPLGKGGMAAVFRARRGERMVALKRPLATVLEDPQFLERFGREADIGRTLHHPNIVRILDRGEVAGVPYFTMELVEGFTLQQRLRAEGPVPVREAVRLVRQVAEALDYAHSKGVVHRDLKPSNIMLGEGRARVMDFGIASARRFEGLTVTGAFLGTPDYVAPEAIETGHSDARSDLYSLGVVFYEVLTARRPFVADTPFAILQKHLKEAPPPPTMWVSSVPAAVEGVVLRLLSKKPGERYADAEALILALDEVSRRL